ncbi:MAG: TonB-dependent receptor [Sphingomonadales bacterium]|nr:TonB-dependent receptor [Sphingomonadales bacterium]
MLKTVLKATTSLAVVASALGWATIAFAEDAKPATAADSGDNGSQVGQIVVTGSRNKQTVLETSYGVTVLGQDAIAKTNPVGLTDLASAIPGLQGEYANGEANSNLNVRGTEAGFMSFISLQEDGLPTQYTPFFGEYEIRNDLSYGRVETVLGGPSGVFTAQGAAATLNFLSRLPKHTEGEVKASISDFGEYRADVFYGGPIGNDGWYGAVGGYFRQSNGARNLGFTGNNGGQVRANIRKEWSNGKLSFAYKKIDDITDYINPLPVDVSGKHPQALPGFNARDDSLMGPDLRYVNTITPGGIVQRDLAEGQHGMIDQFTIAGEYDVSDKITISNKMRYVSTRTNSLDVRGFANASLMKASAFLASELAPLQAAFPTATSVRLVRVSDGAVIANPDTMNGNGLVATADSIDYMRRNKTFIDTLEANYRGSKVNLTGGVQFWKVQQWSGMVSDKLLHNIRNHAERMDVEALDASGNVVGHLTKNGIVTYSDVNNSGTLDTTSINPYLNAEFQVSNALRVDAGIRYEHANISATAQDVTSAPVPAAYYDGTTLAARTLAVVPNGQFVSAKTSFDAVTWTIGANLKLASNLAVYGRYASAHDMGFQNEFSYFSIPAWGTPASANMGLSNNPTRLKFGEVGIRYLGDVFSGSITAFYTKHLRSGIVSVNNSTGANIITPVDTTAYGAEFWLEARPSDTFKVNFSGVIMDSKKTGSGFNSIPTYRLPGTQLRLSPTLDLGNLHLSATGAYYGPRWADQQATYQLPSYLDLSAEIGYDVAKGFRLTVQGRNLTNAFAFTSGNFREGFKQGPNPYGYASAISGRVIRLIADAKF